MFERESEFIPDLITGAPIPWQGRGSQDPDRKIYRSAQLYRSEGSGMAFHKPARSEPDEARFKESTDLNHYRSLDGSNRYLRDAGALSSACGG